MDKLIFKDFKSAVRRQFDTMKNDPLYVVDVERNFLWDIYLNSFPEGANEMYKERHEYDCQSCKQFIRACGHVVSIVDGQLVSIWDISIDGPYKVVADALSKAVKDKVIRDAFYYFQKDVGTDYNIQLLEEGNLGGETIRWEHFHVTLPAVLIKSNEEVGRIMSKLREQKEMLTRAMTELKLDAAETVLELIEQNSLYRGEEHKDTVKLFIKEKKGFDKVPAAGLDNYLWTVSRRLGGASRMRNSVIGTLIVDLSANVDLNDAVKLFEAKVAPQNYKRPTALITKGMIAEAEKKVEALGIDGALQRRFAVTEDITVNNILFADREAKKKMGAFDILKDEVGVDPKKFSKVEEVGIDKFISDILPNVDTVEIIFENQHVNNLMSLIAPMRSNAKPIFQWDNNFSWAYNGEVTDSIKEAVRKAGGIVDGVLNARSLWNDIDSKDDSDLDIWAEEPSGTKIGYSAGYRKDQGNNRTEMSGQLDVDNMSPDGKIAVENITWIDKTKMKDGVYKIWINQYSARNSQGFKAEIEFGGKIYNYAYNRPVRGKVQVAEVTLKKGVFTISHKLPEANTAKTVWGISTQKFHKVNLIMNSPNHWDGHKTGNRHVFFILDGCKNEKKARGFFNEFLRKELTEHRKVFEVLSSKLKAEVTDDQLSGLGFSSTKNSSVVCKLTGAFSRTIKINF